MNKVRKTTGAAATLVAVVLALTPTQALASARLEGLLVGADGRAATGFRVHLIDASGADVAQASASHAGLYSFRDLPAGAYSLGVENTQGQIAPVAAPPVRLADNQLARRDIRLQPATDAEREAVGQINADFGMFWAGLSPMAKTWAIIGTLFFVGVTLVALDNESTATPIAPPSPAQQPAP